ncbi:MAG: molybdopterin molybdotransferase MoeA [Sulfurovum sp.]
MATSITQALDIIYQNTPVIGSEILPIEMALGHILRKDYIASFDLPRFDNSAMDGYAIKCDDADTIVKQTGIIYAGDNASLIVKEGEAIKIMTGSPIPNGCEAIVPIELVELDGQNIKLPQNIKPNAHIRRAGEDIKSGDIYLLDGEKITAYSIALLASQGVTHIEVSRAIKVSLFGTGDELRPHFEKIEPHQLYNSNTPMFLARAKELGCEVQYIQSAGDTIESLEESIKSSLNADIIITSGGVSMGDKDFTKEAFINLGMKLYFDKVDIKPGKPTALGKIGETIIINLAGNPLASMVNYEIFVRAIITKMSGAKAYYQSYITTKIKENFKIRKGKYSVTLGVYDNNSFTPLTKQSPGMISPMPKANGMIITTPEVEYLARGSEVKVIPIDKNIYSEYKEEFLI